MSKPNLSISNIIDSENLKQDIENLKTYQKSVKFVSINDIIKFKDNYIGNHARDNKFMLEVKLQVINELLLSLVGDSDCLK
jgi:hypothetical protein